MAHLLKAQLDLEKKERILSISFGDALKSGFITAIVVGAATVLATKRSAKFSKFMSLSAKVSLPVMASTFVGVVQYEMTMHDLMREKEAVKISKMPFHHQALNYLYDHPFQFIATCGIPLVSVILQQQLKMPGLKFSQRIMHSRVFGQAGILTIALTTMAFRGYMNKHGRYPEPEDLH